MVRRETCDGEPYVCSRAATVVGEGVGFYADVDESFILQVVGNDPDERGTFVLNILPPF